MRHKYETRGIVLARTNVGEATTFVTLLTSELGLVYARAQSLRKPGAKLAAALTTFAESSLILVRGKEGWRIAGAILEENWFVKLGDSSSRERAARIAGLLLRLVAGEERDSQLFSIMKASLETMVTMPDEQEAIEILAVLRLLAALGLDIGEISGDTGSFSPTLLSNILENRVAYIARINNGIAASGL